MCGVAGGGRRDVKDMKLLNLVYDLTPSDLIVVTCPLPLPCPPQPGTAEE